MKFIINSTDAEKATGVIRYTLIAKTLKKMDNFIM